MNFVLWSVILLSAIPWSHRGKHLSWDLIWNYYSRKGRFSLSYAKMLTRSTRLLSSSLPLPKILLLIGDSVASSSAIKKKKTREKLSRRQLLLETEWVNRYAQETAKLWSSQRLQVGEPQGPEESISLKIWIYECESPCSLEGEGVFIASSSGNKTQIPFCKKNSCSNSVFFVFLFMLDTQKIRYAREQGICPLNH